MTRRVAVVVAIVAGIMPTAAWSRPAPVAFKTDCTRLRVTSYPETSADTPRGVFPASQVQDLRFMVTLQGLGAETVDVKIHGPNGHLYQQISVPVPASRVGRGPTKPRQPYEKSLAAAEQQLVTFPVAGTSIRRASLYGAWQVEVRPSGRACSARFRIER